MSTSTSTTTAAAPSTQVPKVQKRFACDDCRARKVQCSGDPTGCVRCRRADIPCHYSAPKPPGRPRKLRRVNTPVEATSLNTRSYDPAASYPTAVEPSFPEVLEGVGGFGSSGFPSFGDNSAWGPTDQDFAGIFAGNFFGSELNNETSSLFNNNSSSLYPDETTMPPSYQIPATTFPTPKSLSSSWSTPSYQALSSQDLLVSSSLQPCGCLPQFFNAISILRQPPNSSDFSLPETLTTIRGAMQTINTSLSCVYCRSSIQTTYVCMMMLGTLIPLILLFIEGSLTSITAARKAIPSTRTVLLTLHDGGPVEVELAPEAWEAMATDAVRKEFLDLMKMISTIEGCLKQRFGTAEGDVLNDITDASKQDEHAMAGGLVAQELTNRAHATAEPPFCVGLLWMIRGMADRVRMRVCE